MLIDVKELSRRLSVKQPTIYSWVRRQKIPYLQLEGVVRFDEDEIAAWIDQRRCGKVGQEGNHETQEGVQP